MEKHSQQAPHEETRSLPFLFLFAYSLKALFFLLVLFQFFSGRKFAAEYALLVQFPNSKMPNFKIILPSI
jgi:hypothetical protein